MMKKLLFNSCFAFLSFYGDCLGMNRTKSEPSLHIGMDIQAETVRPNSAPVTGDEVKKAISKWSYLLPDGAIKDEIDSLLPLLKSHEKKRGIGRFALQ